MPNSQNHQRVVSLEHLERWNAPWWAAFVSWVMCEAGRGRTIQFRRAVAHHSYIDQAIRARDGHASEAEGRVLVIGGNVRGTVSLKLFPADRGAGGPLWLTSTGCADRPTFAHLKLRTESIEAGAFDSSPTVAAFGCLVGTGAPRLARADRVIPGPSPARC